MKKQRLIAGLLVLAMVLTVLALPGTVGLAKKKKNPSKKKILITQEIMSEGILVTFVNKNSMKVDLKASFTYNDANAAELSCEDIENMAFGKDQKIVYFFKAPRNDVNQFIAYSSYHLDYSVQRTGYKNYTSNIEITTSLQPLVMTGTAKNLAPIDLTSINATFIFYDAAGKVLFVKNNYIGCNKMNTATDFEVKFAEYNVQPARVEVIKNWAY